MDERWLSAAHVLALSIVNQPIPETEIPVDRERACAEDADFEFVGVERVVEAIEAGKVVEAHNYYGIPHVWKAGEGVYRGTLLQYRAVTEAPTFTTAQEAAEWFRDVYWETYG